MNPELLDGLLFLRFSNPHISALFSLSFLVAKFLPYWSVLVKQASAPIWISQWQESI
jgi:hypothetical protein